MRVHGEHQVLDRAFEFHHRDALGDQLGREWPDDVHAQDFAELSIADDLHEAVVRADDGGTRISCEGELANLDFAAEFLRLRLCQADAADLRMEIRRTGDAVFADGLRGFARDLRYGDDSAHRA